MGLAINGSAIHGLAIKGQAFPSVQIGDGEIKVGGKAYDLDTTRYFVPNENMTVSTRTINSGDCTLYKGQKYEILNDDTDEYGTRYVAIYVHGTVDFEHGNVTGDIAYIQSESGNLENGKIVGGGN